MGIQIAMSKPRTVSITRKYILRSSILSMKLHSKPKCPHCGKPLLFLYDSPIAAGTLFLKCSCCKHNALINLQTQEIVPVIDDSMLTNIEQAGGACD